jgi:hypothetical protein
MSIAGRARETMLIVAELLKRAALIIPQRPSFRSAHKRQTLMPRASRRLAMENGRAPTGFSPASSKTSKSFMLDRDTTPDGGAVRPHQYEHCVRSGRFVAAACV